MKGACSTLLSQDASEGKLLVRVSVSNRQLEGSRLTISYVDLSGTDAFAIRDTTEKAIDRWATPRFKVPSWGSMQFKKGSIPETPIDLEVK